MYTRQQALTQSATVHAGKVTTSLYDLIATMQTTVAPADDHLIVTTVAHLFRSGRLTFVRPPSRLQSLAAGCTVG
jgi:hypothetical protein